MDARTHKTLDAAGTFRHTAPGTPRAATSPVRRRASCTSVAQVRRAMTSRMAEVGGAGGP